jgi:hypothetical protein
MIKRLTFIVLFTLALLATAFPVHAQVQDIYVDLAWKGTESGTQAEPYNMLDEARAFAQAKPGGAWLNVKQADGTWRRTEYVPPVKPGPYGIPLANATLYALLAVLALALILVGWRFQRRYAQLQDG